jgi:hypothetical protein
VKTLISVTILALAEIVVIGGFPQPDKTKGKTTKSAQMVTATTRSTAAREFSREYFAVSHFVVQELSQFGRDVRTPPSASKQLRAINVDGAMLTRMDDLHYSVAQRFISSQSRDNFYSALSRPSTGGAHRGSHSRKPRSKVQEDFVAWRS